MASYIIYDAGQCKIFEPIIGEKPRNSLVIRSVFPPKIDYIVPFGKLR